MQRVKPSLLNRQFALKILKLLLVGGFLYFLFQRGLISMEATRDAFGHWDRLGLALSANVAVVLLSFFRWQVLLRVQGIRISFAKSCQLGMIGSFFNLALPGGVSGDVLKAVYVNRQQKTGALSAIMASILVDRLLGVSALVLVAAGALAVGFETFGSSPTFQGIRWFLYVVTFAVVGFYGYWLGVGEARDPLIALLKKGRARWPRLEPLVRFYDGMWRYHQHRGALVGTLLLSVGIHLLSGWGCYNLARALGETNLPMLSVLLVFPLGTLVNIVPLAPAGIGTGHGAFLYLFSLVGSARGADVYSFLAAIMLLCGALGGLVYLPFKSGTTFSDRT